MANTTERSDSKVYEIGYILLSSIPEEKVSSEVDSLKAMLVKQNAAVIAEGAPTLKTLTYTMVKKIGTANRRFNQGYFGWIKFEAEAEAIAKINKALGENDSLLRSIVINTLREHTLLSETLALEEKAEAAEKAAAAEVEASDKSAEKAASELAA